MQLRSPYLRLMRLHQPTGIFLLMWPCWWALTLASGGNPPLDLLALFALGAIVMRSAGCIINDIADRHFDARVERTKTRPLASGEVSLMRAAYLLIALLFVAAIIAYALGMQVLLWSMASLPLVAAYPFMKRITWWPQMFLGLTFNWGALLGWIAVRGEIELPSMMLYLGSIFWTLGYDTIYAHQDKKDDAKIGVKSTARKLGSHTKFAVGIFYSFALLGWGLAGINALGIMLAGLHMAWQIVHLDIENPTSCRATFMANRVLGAVLFLSTLITI